MKKLQNFSLLPVLALTHVFVKTIGSVSIHPVLTGPDMAYVNTRVLFRCFAHNSPLPVTYELMQDSSDHSAVIATQTHFQADQPASFNIKVTATSEGSYQCKATTEGSTGVSNSIRLTVVTPASNTRVTSEPFPPVVFEGSHVNLSCVVSKGSHLSYIWFFNMKEITSSMSSFFNITRDKLVIEQVTPEHAGHYSCIAWSRVQDVNRFSSSADVQLTVKVYMSKPKLSFSISKEGDSYRGNITCWSSRGSPPVNFSLSVDDKEVGSFTATEFPAAWFSVPMVPGVDMGVAQCQVKTEVQELMSDPVILVVVPVGGDVKVEVEHLYRADSKLAAIILRCQISRGTFPYVSWFINDSVLPAERHAHSHFQPVLAHYALTDHGRTLVLTTPGPEESGYYYCSVRDSYDESGPRVESAAVLVQVTDRMLNSVTRVTSSPASPPKEFWTNIELITIVFCCFLLLMLAVGVACVYKMFDHKQALAHITTTNSDNIPLPALSSQLEGNQANTSATHCDAQNHNQAIEITL